MADQLARRHVLAFALMIALIAGGLLFVEGEQSQQWFGRTAQPTPIRATELTPVSTNEGEHRHFQPVFEDNRNLGMPANLPRPSSVSVPEFEKQLFKFVHERKYQELNWSVDKTIRDTGPYINGRAYGTHPAVRVYYSPEIISWLMSGRRGTIPDGAMMIKEQYPEPAVQHVEKSESELQASLKSWTVMVKDAKGSHDGWFWSNPYANDKNSGREPHVLDNHKYPYPHPESGFGHYCVRCHSATQSPNVDIEKPAVNNEFTFAALRNIKGFPGEPIIFLIDDSWRKKKEEEKLVEENIDEATDKKLITNLEQAKLDQQETKSSSHPKCTATDFPEQCELLLNNSFLQTFNQIKPQKKEDISHIPPVTHDWVVKGASGGQDLITSNQCMSCHAGLVGPFGPSMVVGLKEGDLDYRDPVWHVSPYGEWRWTPMGLAGRDPIFFAQLESEIAMLKKEFSPEKAAEISAALQDTCLRCHGAMGKHQFDLDKTDPNEKFSVKHMYAVAEEGQHIGHGDSKYGALARDGISCMICHRSQPREKAEGDERSDLQFFLETSITGNFHLGPPDEIYGPFKDDEISTYAMEHGIAIKPKYSEYIQSSQMCGTCHTVSLPVVDDPFEDRKPNAGQQSLVDGEIVPMFRKFHHHVEQATYLEWLNSEFENEYNTDNPKAQSCQECHMSKGLVDEEDQINIEQLQTRIAAIQDNTYPHAENLTELEQLKIRIREEGYKRHNFVGLNVFLVELFRQFDEVLGVRKNDFMTGSSIDIPHAIKTFKRQARNDVVDLALGTKIAGNQLTATLDIKNKVGHRFPSGVGFRRAFVEFLVLEKQADGEDKVVWGSGRTDENGILVSADGQRLATEFFEPKGDNDKQQQFQKHHSVINSQDQVQVYETLLKDRNQRFTTSFIHGSHTMKDNRLLPRGWKAEGPHPDLNGEYLRATHPGPEAKKDPRYTDGSGSDEIVYSINLPSGVDTSKLTVKASIFYQATPPYFLKNLFDNAPESEAVKRVHYMFSFANLKDTAIEDWKLLVNSVETNVSQ